MNPSALGSGASWQPRALLLLLFFLMVAPCKRALSPYRTSTTGTLGYTNSVVVYVVVLVVAVGSIRIDG